MIDNENNNNDLNKVNESGAVYNTKKITFFKSFEEMNEFDHKRCAALTPAESLSEVTLMRLKMFPHLNSNLNPWGSQIYFDL